MDDFTRVQIARDFWIDQALTVQGVRAVNPDARWDGYENWTRDQLKRWTLGRLRAVKPRYRRCVDLGCGFGDWTELFATIAEEVHACDVAPAFVEQTRRRVPTAVVECADLRAYAVPRNADFVYIGAVLLYLPDADVLDVLRGIRAAAAPGAVIVWRDWCAFNLGLRTINESRERFSIHRRAGELRRLAELARFRVTEVRSAPSIYGEAMSARFQWPLRALWRLATAPWRRTSFSVIMRT